jgi:hypothetical protein
LQAFNFQFVLKCYLAIIFTVFCFGLYGQSKKPDLVFYTPNLEPFILFINGEPQSKWPKSTYVIDTILPGNKQFKFWFNPKKDNAITKEKAYELAFFTKTEIALFPNKENWFLEQNSTRDTLKYVKAKPVVKLSFPLSYSLSPEVFLLSRNEVKPSVFMPFSVLPSPKSSENYFGKIGCKKTSLNDKNLFQILSQMDVLNTDLERVVEAVNLIRGECLCARDLGYLSNLIESEALRFELLLYGLNQGYDLHNFEALISYLHEYRYKRAFRLALNELLGI